MTPQVSVVMPVFNAARFLRPAIDSILAQTFGDFEFIIVDDGSTDESPAIVASYGDPRVRVVRTGRQSGVAAALNAGAREAAAALIARQDADDVSEPARLGKQVEAFASRSDLGLLGTQGVIIDEQGHERGAIERSTSDAALRWCLLLDNAFVHTSVMFRRAAFDVCGGYLERPKPFPEDYSLWCRMARRFEVGNLADTLVRFRLSEASTTGPLAFGTADAAYAASFAEIIRAIVAENLSSMFGANISAADAALLARFVPGVPADQAPAFCEAFERLLAAFERRYPRQTTSHDFVRTLARQYDAIAFRLSPPDRWRSLGVYADGIRRRPPIAATLSWTRALALVIVGRGLRQRLS